ncbi:hypothetical protein HN51_004890 [Arachis hypogaea]
MAGRSSWHRKESRLPPTATYRREVAQVLLTIQMLKDEVQTLFDDAGKRIDLATPLPHPFTVHVYSNASDGNEPLALDMGSMGKGSVARAIDVLNFTPLNNKPIKKKKEMFDKFCETPFYLKLLKEHGLINVDYELEVEDEFLSIFWKAWRDPYVVSLDKVVDVDRNLGDEKVIGDGLLMSNAKLIERAVLEYACNVLLLKSLQFFVVVSDGVFDYANNVLQYFHPHHHRVHEEVQ